MSWTNELYRVYELMEGKENCPAPVAHSTANAQIELMIDEEGNFKSAAVIPKEDEETIIPVYEDSASRSSTKASPHALNDKLKYLAGDYSKYVQDENGNNKYYDEYIKRLEIWKDSIYSHATVRAIYAYLTRRTLVQDLITTGILRIDETGKLAKKKINQTEQKDVFIRFVVQYNSLNLYIEQRSWMDVSLQNYFQEYNYTKLRKDLKLQLCYATGETLPCTYNHPKQLVKNATNAKIISSNDKDGFTFRGRFSDKAEALSISYDFSQKMHNALKWLIKKQGQNFGTLTLVTWASALQSLPNELQDGNIEDEWGEDEAYDSLPLYKAWMSRYLMGYKQKFQDETKIMIMGLDATIKTSGRLSVTLYDELYGSEFLKNLELWHVNSACLRLDKKKGKSVVKSCSLYEIIRASYGIEKNGKLECEDKLFSDSILRLLPCIMKKQNLPQNLIQALYHKASNPLSYDRRSNHRLVIEVACSMMRKKLKEKIEGVEFMAYDPNEKDRNYLYGCLLAIADKTEFDTYNERDRENRVTNARRYWLKFSQRPYQTWKIIEERLYPYINQYPYKTKILIEEKIQEVTEKFTRKEFEDNSHLNPLYLLGYHHFRAYMSKHRLKEEK